MPTSTITIDVHLDKDKVPEQINWKADSSTADENKSKSYDACILGWCRQSALRIDLWTKDMMVDEMADFFIKRLHQWQTLPAGHEQ